MDAFTENILARARERQKMLEGYTGSDKTPLRETNKDIKSSSQPNLTDVNKTKRKEVVSDSAVGTKSQNILLSKENNSDTNLSRLPRQNSKTRISSEIPGSPQSQSKTLNIQNDNFNMEIKLTSSENIRVEVAIEEQDDSDTGSQMSESGLRDESKNKLKRLGKLYAGGVDAQISSPIHRTEAKFYASENIDVEKNRELPESGSKCRKGLSRLADLAQTINQWEDDVNPNRSEKKTPPRRTWKPPAPQPPGTSPPKPSSVKPLVKGKAPEPPVIKKYGHNGGSVSDIKENVQFSPAKVHSPRKTVQGSPKKTAEGTPGTGATPKQLKWDKNVLDTLESQGFTRTTSNARLVYSYNSQDKKSNEVKTAQTTIITKAQIERKPNTIIEEEEPVAKDEADDCSCPKTPPKAKPKAAVEQKMPKSPSKNNLAANIADKAAIFEMSVNKNTKDPALLSVSERKALFEKNRGTALVPKAPIGLSAPVKVETTMKASSTKIITDENFKPSSVLKQNALEPTKPMASKVGKYVAPKPPPLENTLQVKPPAVEITSPARAAAQKCGGIASRIALLQENKSTISQEQIEHSVRNQRDKELGMLLNRFNKHKEVSQEQGEESEDEEVDATEETAMITKKSVEIVSSLAGNKPGEKRKSGEKRYGQGDSPVVTAVLDDVKRIRVSPPKVGKLYPNLSDIEATTETETDNQTRTPSPDNDSSLDNSDDPNTSFGRDILQAVCKNQTPLKRPIYDESTASDLSSILDDVEYLDELSNEENSSVGPTPPKQVCQLYQEKVSVQPSDSFNYKCFSPSAKSVSKFQSPVKIITSPKRQTELPTHVVEGDDVLPLTHTVSFYRKQQNQVHTPVRQITRQPLIEESPKEVSQENDLVQEKISELQEEVNMQQNIVSQTSQALNLCSSTLEFSGSTEQVEAERVLLVATHRRQAALHELQRLRVEGTIRPQGQHSHNVPLEKGTLTISNIVLPLKQKYVKALAAAGGKGHHVVCLIKCGEQVVPTKLVSTVVSNVKNPEMELSIPGTVKLNNIYSDFTVTFEVYCLQAQEEFLPHEIKYHINNKKSGTKLTTPKKSKQESRMVMPLKESPAGAQAVRTSSFALMGYVVFSVQAVNKRVWSLNNTPSMSPLEGSVEMLICCELAVSVEHRGFLTMFEDVSGFGAWHRRWCLLKGHTLCYWKYPDDEKKMAPIDTIDLKNCITKEVSPVNREICARLHTFLLERERTARPQDKDTLVTICKGEKTIIRHLLSADTKEERIEWCKKFNAALTALRMWGNTQQ